MFRAGERPTHLFLSRRDGEFRAVHDERTRPALMGLALAFFGESGQERRLHTMFSLIRVVTRGNVLYFQQITHLNALVCKEK